MAKIIKGEGSALHTIPTPPAREGSVVAQRPKKPVPRYAEQAKDEALAIIARAKREAKLLYEAVEAETAEAIAEASQQGHAAGIADTEALKNKISQLEAELIREVEPEAVRATIQIARRLFAAELEQFPETIVSVVRQALLSSRQQREVFVRINPIHADAVRQYKSDIVDVLARAKDIEIREDSEISAGGCVVETEVGSVDARLETQFEVLERYLTSGKV